MKRNAPILLYLVIVFAGINGYYNCVKKAPSPMAERRAVAADTASPVRVILSAGEAVNVPAKKRKPGGDAEARHDSKPFITLNSAPITGRR